MTPPSHSRRSGSGISILERLANARGVSGNEKEVREILIEVVKDRVDEYRIDSLGNLITFKRGKGARRGGGLRVMLAAHMDEVGILIVHIEANGQLRFRKVGGIDDRVLLSKVVLIGKERVPGVIGVKPIHLSKPKEREQVIDVESMSIDIGCKSKEEVEAVVHIGDYGTFATTFSEMGGGLAKGKAFDDRTGCAALVEVLKKEYPFDLYGVFTTQEEVGLRGAQVAGYALEPDVAFVLESTACDDTPKKKQPYPLPRVGGGAVITLADSSLIPDRRLVKILVETAREQRIAHQFKAAMRGGTDGGRIALAREGVPAAVVAVPTRYIHSPVSVLSLQDYESMVALVTKALPRLAQGLPER